MRRIALSLAGLLIAMDAHAAFYSLTLDGGYLYSRWEYQSPTSTFSLLSRAGQTARGTFTVGSKRLELIAGGGIDNFKFTAPETRMLTAAEISTSMYLAGLRYKTPSIWTSLTFQAKDALFLVENSPTAFELKKAGVGFAVGGITLFGWGQGYKITIDGEYGIPVSSPKNDYGTIKMSYFTRGTARVEFGSVFRVGVFTGIENQEYLMNSTNKFYRSDFFGGLTIAIGAGKSGKGGGGSKGWGSGNVPNYPL